MRRIYTWISWREWLMMDDHRRNPKPYWFSPPTMHDWIDL